MVNPTNRRHFWRRHQRRIGKITKNLQVTKGQTTRESNYMAGEEITASSRSKNSERIPGLNRIQRRKKEKRN